jgi:NADH-quinone oxidoreductase subunit C
MEETLDRLATIIKGSLAPAVTGYEIVRGELTLHARASDILEVATFLRDDPSCAFACIIDITAVDWPGRTQRFDVVYHFLSPVMNQRVRVKIITDETTPVASIVGIYRGADWFEREIYDLYGVLFTGHPDMRRILTDYGFEGHPLRKDFPLTGFVEVRWDDQEKRVRYDKVKLSQEFRNFDFISPWDGTEYTLPGDEKVAPGAANKLTGEPEKKPSP